VCFQWKTPGHPAELIHAILEEKRAYDLAYWLLTDSEVRIVGHNIAFDLAVVGARWPALVPLIFAAYKADRVACTIVREKLHDIELGMRRVRAYDMESVASRRKLGTVDKSDPWRLRYWELRNTPCGEWPADAVAYALGDVDTTLDLYLAQSEKRDEYRQARADWWLKLVSAWGMMTDPEQVQRFYDATRAELLAERKLLQDLGIVRHNGSKDTKAAKQRMLNACGALGVDPMLTDTGQVSLSKEACEEIGDEVLQAYCRYTSHGTILGRVKRLAHGVHTPIQPQFDSLVETGRTSVRQGDVDPGKPVSAWGFQTQNVHRAKGLRECFRARKGMVFIATDYDKCELCTVSQVNILMHRDLGRPASDVKLAAELNAGVDPHLSLGARIIGISYAEALARKKDPIVKDARQCSKSANFGFPGGLGFAGFLNFAKFQYGVKMGEATARKLKADWLAQYPEFTLYFTIIRNQLKEVGKDDEGNPKLRADILHPYSYRLRGRVPFTVACNTYFQGLAADLAKDAGFLIAQECYCDSHSPLFGYRIINFVHDEIIIEGPRETCHAAAVRMKEIMEDAGRRWCPDVPPKATPSVMRAWSKAADDTVDPTTGLYTPYEEMPRAV